MKFKNRVEAGEKLADALRKYASQPDLVVVGLPRGGIPVAQAVAQRLKAPLELLNVGKLSVPGRESFAVGAIAADGMRVVNNHMLQSLYLSPATVDTMSAKEYAELQRREKVHRGGHLPRSLRGKVVIIVDDGIVTGTTMRAAISAVRSQRPQRIVVATPVILLETSLEMEGAADALVAVSTPPDFGKLDDCYENFSPVSDEQVHEWYEAARNIGRATDHT